MIKPDADAADALAQYKTRRKEIQARYYQRNRKIIKLAWSLNISMKTARSIARQELRT
jgi:flavin-dependent dehydrogenase